MMRQSALWIFAITSAICLGATSYQIGKVANDREWRKTLKIGADVSLESFSKEMWVIPAPPPLPNDAFAKKPNWVAKPPTGLVAQHPEAAKEQSLNPNSKCRRCQRPWWRDDVGVKGIGVGVKSHSTPYSVEGGCFPLCQSCWSMLTPQERLPYYEDLWHVWDESKSNDLPLGVMRAACLYETGNEYNAPEDLPPEIIAEWEKAGGMPEIPSI